MSETIEKLFELFQHCNGVTIDTRNISAGEMFFGLKGSNVNGNEFAQKALDNGAICCVVDDENYVIDHHCILVEDSLIALQDLAKRYRSTFQFPVLAITGTNGKTTTKELITKVLSAKYITSATKGNLNNHIGVPLTLLSVKKDCEFAIIEMGANHQKEIEFYCSIADPDFALITNIGKAHLEGFGGIEGVLKAKSELYQYVMEKQGILFVNSGQHLLDEIIRDYKMVVKYGFKENDYLTGKILLLDEFASVEVDDEIQIHSNLVGNYNAENILAAACVGKYFDVGYSDIKSAIEDFYPENNRSELKEIGGNYFILDAYNANPSSMKAALENFHHLKAEKKIVLIGDMLELGEFSESEHKEILQIALGYKFDTIVTIGPEFLKHKTSGIIQFMNSYEAKEWFNEQQFNGATILLKGSRGMQLEKVINNK